MLLDRLEQRAPMGLEYQTVAKLSGGFTLRLNDMKGKFKKSNFFPQSLNSGATGGGYLSGYIHKIRRDFQSSLFSLRRLLPDQ